MAKYARTRPAQDLMPMLSTLPLLACLHGSFRFSFFPSPSMIRRAFSFPDALKRLRNIHLLLGDRRKRRPER